MKTRKTKMCFIIFIFRCFYFFYFGYHEYARIINIPTDFILAYRKQRVGTPII